MKIWLPEPLYRAKPFLMMLFGAVLLCVTDHTLLAICAFVYLGYGSWIVVVRAMWRDDGIVTNCYNASTSGKGKTISDIVSENG